MSLTRQQAQDRGGAAKPTSTGSLGGTTQAGPGNGGHIVLEGIGKSYGGTDVVPRLDLTIKRGEFFALLGPSGCGKTTTLRIIAGLEEPTRGRVHLDGVDVTNTPSSRRNVNMVFQSHALFPNLTVWENVAFGLRVRRVPRSQISTRVRDALAMVRLAGVEQRRPAELSGGQQQRVALARALVNLPAALLLDEPLGALDLALRRAMQRELKDIQARTDTTFVYVTHDQEEAMVMADRVAVMRDGRLEQVGTCRELYNAPTSTFVAGFVGASNILSGRAELAPGDLVRLAVDDGDVFVDVPAHRATERLHVVVRPERISLRPLPEPASVMTGTVTRATFLGQFTEYRVQTSSGRELIVHDLGVDAGPQVGDRVHMYWRAADSIELAEADVKS